MVICLEQGADLHMVQLIPLPLAFSCFSKIKIGFTFLVPVHPGSPGQRAVKWVCVRVRVRVRVRVCVCVCVLAAHYGMLLFDAVRKWLYKLCVLFTIIVVKTFNVCV